MPANHSTSHSPAATPQPAATPRAHATAAGKTAKSQGKSANKTPAKPAGKTAAAAKASVKKTAGAQPKVASKTVKAVVKPPKASTKAGSARPAPSKPAPKAGKGALPKGKADPKGGKAAAPLKAAPAVTKAVSPKAGEVPVSKEKPHVNDHASAGPAAVHANHAKPATPDHAGIAPAAKLAPKTDKPEHKKDRPHEDGHKKPVVKRSSLVDFPVPPPPVRPPFVPPKPATTLAEELAPAGVNASHSPAFIQKQRQRLLDLRDDLVDALSGMTRDTIRNAPEGSEASGSGMHQGDAGSDAYDRDFALSVLAKEQDALYEIDQALRRIQKGIYGVCEMSNRKIPQARLEAIPFARLTVECQSQWEKEYGNRRFRPSNEVGFSGGNLIEDEDSETVLLDEDED